MERNYDEVIAEMLIELDQLHRKGMAQDERNGKFDKRLDLTIKRMVKAEKRLDDSDKGIELLNKKMELSFKEQREYYKVIYQSIKELKEFSRIQNEINRYFLKEIGKNGHKK